MPLAALAPVAGAALAAAAFPPAPSGAGSTRAVVYGKYADSSGSTAHNTYYLHSPATMKAGALLPVVIQIHGGGFTGGSAVTGITPAVEPFLAAGVHYMSVDYRVVTKKYYAGGAEEEFIHAAADGSLTLDTSGKVMSDYSVRVGRQELITKCAYDAAQALEHLIAHAAEYQVDVHKIGVTGGSAGGAEIHYLTWVYHALHAGRYTPVSMVYNGGQLNYPVNNMLDGAWNLWASDVGADTPLSRILASGDCDTIVGNDCCGPNARPSETEVCNSTWHDASVARYCGSNFASTKLGQLAATQVWARDTEQAKGIARLWYTTENMLAHQPTPDFHLYMSNSMNSTQGMNVVHNALYARNYAKYAKQAGLKYATYWTDYNGMTAADKGDQRFDVIGRGGAAETYNYQSNFGFAGLPGISALGRVSAEEQLQFHCIAMGINCTAAPSPPGPPAPGACCDSGCNAALQQYCPDRSDAAACDACVGPSGGHVPAFIAAGCPGGNGAAAEVQKYWCGN